MKTDACLLVVLITALPVSAQVTEVGVLDFPTSTTSRVAARSSRVAETAADVDTVRLCLLRASGGGVCTRAMG